MARGNPVALLWINHKTIRQRRYGGRSMAAKMANIRRPIKRPWRPITRSTLRRRDELLSEVLFFASSTMG